MDYALTGKTKEALHLTAANAQHAKQAIEAQLPLAPYSLSEHSATTLGDTAYVTYRLDEGQSGYAHLTLTSVKNTWRVKDFSINDSAEHLNNAP